MHFAFDEEGLAAQAALRALLEKVCPPSVVRAAWAGGPRDGALWGSLVEMGLVGLTIPEAHGGLGRGELDLVLLLEECGRAAVPAPVLETVAVGAPLLADLGATSLGTRFLPLVAGGEATLAVALAGA